METLRFLFGLLTVCASLSARAEIFIDRCDQQIKVVIQHPKFEESLQHSYQLANEGLEMLLALKFEVLSHHKFESLRPGPEFEKIVEIAAKKINQKWAVLKTTKGETIFGSDNMKMWDNIILHKDSPLAYVIYQQRNVDPLEIYYQEIAYLKRIVPDFFHISALDEKPRFNQIRIQESPTRIFSKTILGPADLMDTGVTYENFEFAGYDGWLNTHMLKYGSKPDQVCSDHFRHKYNRLVFDKYFRIYANEYSLKFHSKYWER